MTFVTYLLIALSFILSQRWRQNKISANLFRISIVAAISFALSNVSYAIQPISVDTSKSIEIAAVQGGVERTGLGVLGEPRAVLERHISQTLKNLSEINSSDLLVWPESSIDLDPDRDSETMELLQSLDEKVEPAILANATFYKPDTVKNNVSILIDENQFKMVYQKRRLVPFGEFLPLRSLIEAYTDRASMLSNDYQPGTAAGSIDVSGIKIGLLICFEIADDSLIHDGIEQQSAVIVQTNNATYQYLGQSEQQGLYTRLRAIEVGRPIVSISTSGISLIVNERGQVVHQLTQDQVGLLSTEFHWREGETFATKIHDLWLFLIVGAFISGSILMIRRSSKIKS
jgi:apolipoprotein N-acyltransferase